MKKIENVLAIFKENFFFFELLSLLSDEGYKVKHIENLGIKRINSNVKILLIDLDSKKIKKDLINYFQTHSSTPYIFGITNQNTPIPNFENFRIIRGPLIFSSFLDNFKKILNRKTFKLELIKIGELTINTKKLTLTNKKSGYQTNLTELENKFLSYIVNKKGGASKSEILKDVWGHNNQLNTHTLESLIYRLRRKIEKNPNEPEFLIQFKQKYSLKNTN